MFASPTVFLDFNLPNATTWFYFSLLLAIALFFKFSRVLSIRNWDVVLLFLLVPGLLLIQSARPPATPTEKHPAVGVARLVGQGTLAGVGSSTAALGSIAEFLGQESGRLESASWRWLGYLWLLIGSIYLLLRCLFDLTLVQRPALAPNLTFGGLAWFAGALFVCLMVVAFRPAPGPNVQPEPGVQIDTAPVGPRSAPLDLAQKQLERTIWPERLLAVFCHLLVVIGMVIIGRVHFQDTAAGMGAATFYLLLPYTGMFVGQAHHIWPTALVIWAFVTYRSPVWAGICLGLAAGTMYFPALIVPLWVSFYWRRGAARFFAAALVASLFALTVTAFNLLWHDQLDTALTEAWSQTAWQAWKAPTTEGLWTGVHGSYRIPIFLAYIAFVLLTSFWPMPKNLAHVMALSAAVFIGIQFWYADQGGVYVLWYLPLLLLQAFRPNLEDRRPPQLPGGRHWILRLANRLRRLAYRRPIQPRQPVNS